MSQPGPTSLFQQTLMDAYQKALDTHSIVSMTDRHGTITHANDMFCAISGYKCEELIGSTHALLNSGEHDKAFFADMWRTIGRGDTWTGEVCNRAKDGSTYWVDTVITPLAADDDSIAGFVSVRRDISKRKQAEALLKRNEGFLRDVASVAKVGGWSLELETGFLHWSEETKRIHEVPPDYEPSVETAINFYAPEARTAITAAVEQGIDAGTPWDLELPLITAKDRHIWVRAFGRVVEKQGKPHSLIGAFQDITDRKSVESDLRELVTQRHAAEQLLRDVLETIPDAVAAYDKDDRLIIWNSSYMETYAASAEAIKQGATFESILRFGLQRGQYAEAGQTKEMQEAWLTKRLEDHRRPPGQLVQKLADGTWLQIREHRSETETIVGVRSDITALKRAESKLQRYADQDALTGLFSRSKFSQLIDQLLGKISRDTARGVRSADKPSACVALFDLDHFKPVNDAYGHDVGDEVLIAISDRLRNLLGPQDFAARLGGDEFVLALCGEDARSHATDVFERLFAALEEPIPTRAGDMAIGVSLGVTLIDGDDITTRDLLKQADIAQYRAKQEGRGCWRWFDGDDRARMRKEKVMGAALRRDLERLENLSFIFRPIAGAADRVPLGFSSELSWAHDGDAVMGTALRAVARKSGKSADLCNCKMENLMTVVGSYQQRGVACGQFWVSVGTERARLNGFAEQLESMRERNGVTACSIIVAVLESSLLDRSAAAVTREIQQLRTLGFQIGLDGFGASASSPSLLEELGVTAMRLSPSLTDNLVNPDDDTASRHKSLKALIAMAKALDIEVFAQEVKTPEQAALLAHFGCDGLQGPLIGQPMEIQDVDAFLAGSAARLLAGLGGGPRSPGWRDGSSAHSLVNRGSNAA
ncbi:MAG: diguanylate cyclase [Cohaesibacteraceae bacterium]